MEGRRLLGSFGSVDRFTFLRRLGLDPNDAARLDVATGTIGTGGMYVEARSGETRLMAEGEAVPDGVWIAQRDLDDLGNGRAEPVEVGGRHGFGEGWGAQGAQLGDDPPAAPSEGGIRSDAYLPGATGDPTQDPASEQGLSPVFPDLDAAELGRDQPPISRDEE